jgi:hypothetical protein
MEICVNVNFKNVCVDYYNTDFDMLFKNHLAPLWYWLVANSFLQHGFDTWITKEKKNQQPLVPIVANIVGQLYNKKNSTNVLPNHAICTKSLFPVRDSRYSIGLNDQVLILLL